MISDRMSTIWITLNPSNLWSFLILILAKVQLGDNSSNAFAEEFKQATAIINLMAIAQFFEAIYTSIFKRFLAARSIENRLFGPVLTYFRTVKTNSQRILYLYYLVLLRGAFYLAKLRNLLLFDSQYIANLINFIDFIICCSMADLLVSENTHQEAPSVSLSESNKKFALKLNKNSNFVAFKTQIYSFLHNATCFKYRAAASTKWWFNFLHSCIDKTRVTKLGSINISQNDPWVNLWNLALASIIKSNCNINFILSNIKILAFVCYIKNYATKRDCS